MFDFSHFETLSEGEERLRYLKKCILTADHSKNTAEALDLRYKYIRESVFHSDSFGAMIMFPEYMSMFSANTDKHSPLSFMTAFKWFIGEMTSYYQVTAKKSEEYFEKYRELLNVFGYSMRTYHMLRIKYWLIHDPAKIPKHLTLFRSCSSDDLSDCRACELDTEIQAALQNGSEEKAVRMLASLTETNISCESVPRKTYGRCVEHFTKIGDLEEADYYADLLIPMLGADPCFLAEAGNILLLKSYTAPNSAYSLFCKYLDMFIRSKNPKMKFAFANAAAVFFENVNRDENELITMKLPRTFELFNEENQYDPDIMFGYFRDIASEIAEKFDSSYGNTYFSDILDFEYPTEPVKELSLPEHGIIERSAFSVAVPFPEEDDIPSGEEIIELLRQVPDIEFNDISAADKSSIIICGYNSYIETGFICRINICEPEDLEDYHIIHRIPEKVVNSVTEKCHSTVVISSLFHKGTENAEMTALLQFADAINQGRSPVILCVTNGTMLSSDWVHFHAEGRLPLYDKYLYNVVACPTMLEDEEGKLDVITTGLAQQASRDLTVLGVDPDDLEFIHLVFSQIADLICGFTELRDEGCTTGFGVVYNDEAEVQFSWIPMEKAYPDVYSSFDDLAVPILYLRADDADLKKGFLVNEVPKEAREKIVFRNSLKSIRIEAVLSKRNLPYAFDALERIEGSELIIALTVRPDNVAVIDDDDEDDELSDEICISAESMDPDAGTVTGRVEVDSEISPDYELHKTVTLPIDDIIFWRFKTENESFTPDETYLLLQEND